MELSGKVVWITGAGRRLGRALALELARRGADIAVHYGRSQAEAEEVAGQIRALGRRALTVQADLAQVPQIEAMAARIETELGRLDVLVNNAATFERTPLDQVTEDDWRRAIDVNLKGAFFCAVQAARVMRRTVGGGRIVNIADGAGLRPYRNFCPYMISKGGLVTMTQAMAVELAPHILVNAVAPGVVLPPEQLSPEQRERALSPIPLGRFGQPGDVVETVAFLIEKGDYITGQVLCVDGGRSVSTSDRDL